MGLADELKTLQELHTQGKLTDQEFADAKAATLKKHQEPAPVHQALHTLQSHLRLDELYCYWS